MTTPGGVPNLPLGALTLDTIASNLHDMTNTAMKSRAVERFPAIFNNSTGLNPALEITPFGILTTIWAQVNSLIANADPADIQGPDDLPELVLDFIEGLPFVGQYISLLEAILGTYDGDDENLLFVQEIFAPIRKLMELITGIEGIPGVEDLTAAWDSLGLGQIGDLLGLFPGFSDNGDGTLSSILEGLFTDNGDGTWSFIENGVNTLFDLGDGTLASPAGALLSLLGQLGTFQATIDRQQAIIDSLFNAVHYTDIFGTQVEQLLESLRNIPSLNILGVAGPSNIGDSVLEFLNSIVGGAYGTPGSGASLANAFDALSWLSSGSFLGRGAFDILGNRGNKSFLTGLLPSSVSAVALPYKGATPTTFGVTSTAATTLWHRFQESMSLGVIRWWGQTTTSITDMRVAIKQMNAVTGDVTLIHESANIIGDVSNTLGVNKYEIPTPVAVLANEIYGAEVSVRAGAGTYQIVGDPTWMTNDPNVFPRRMSSTRNPSGAAHPSTITSGSVTYASNVPHMEFAVDLGAGVEYHEPLLELYPTSGTRVIPTWANYVEVIAVGCGGGGAGGSTALGINGEHGDPGTWSTATWTRTTDFTGTPTITVTINNGGAGGGLYSDGAAGGDCIAAITGHTVTATGGDGGNNLGVAAGPGPGDQTYGINPVPPPYTGGAQQNTASGAGNAPGGAGAGGGYFGSGGTGAKGAVWLRFRQT